MVGEYAHPTESSRREKVSRLRLRDKFKTILSVSLCHNPFISARRSKIFNHGFHGLLGWDFGIQILFLIRVIREIRG